MVKLKRYVVSHEQVHQIVESITTFQASQDFDSQLSYNLLEITAKLNDYQNNGSITFEHIY